MMKNHNSTLKAPRSAGRSAIYQTILEAAIAAIMFGSLVFAIIKS